MIDVIGMLCEKFPAAFFQFERRRKPLALGIHKQIAEALPTLNKVQISGAMRRYVKNTFYLKACVEGASRIDLNGEAAGTVSGNDAASCASRLAAIKLARKRKMRQKELDGSIDRSLALAANPEQDKAAEIEVAKPVPKGPNAGKRTLHLKGMSSI